MKLILSKDGKEFVEYETDDPEVDMPKIKAKGYKEYFDVRKGDKRITIPSEMFGEAQKKGYSLDTPEVQEAKAQEAEALAEVEKGKEEYYGGIKGKLEAAARGMRQGYTLGSADEIAAAAKSGTGTGFLAGTTAAELAEGKETKKPTYEEALKEERGALKEAEKYAPYTTGAGDIAGSIISPVNLIPGMGVGSKILGKAAPTVGKVLDVTGRAAIEGAVEGAGRSEADTTTGVLEDATTGAMWGAGAGAALAGTGAFLGSSIKRLWKGSPSETKEKLVARFIEHPTARIELEEIVKEAPDFLDKLYAKVPEKRAQMLENIKKLEGQSAEQVLASPERNTFTQGIFWGDAEGAKKAIEIAEEALDQVDDAVKATDIYKSAKNKIDITKEYPDRFPTKGEWVLEQILSAGEELNNPRLQKAARDIIDVGIGRAEKEVKVRISHGTKTVPKIEKRKIRESVGVIPKVIAKASTFTPGGIGSEYEDVYAKLLANPRKYKKAVDASKELVGNYDTYEKQAKALIDGLKEGVEDTYEAGIQKAKDTLLEGMGEKGENVADAFMANVDVETKRIEKAAQKMDAHSNFYSSAVMDNINNKVLPSIRGEGPRIDKNDIDVVRKLDGIRHARKYVDDALPRSSGDKSALTIDDIELLREVREYLDEMMKGDNAGGIQEDIRKIDKLYREYKTQGTKLFGQITDKQDDIKPAKLIELLKDAGGVGKQMEREIATKQFTDFLKKNKEIANYKLKGGDLEGVSIRDIYKLLQQSADPLRDYKRIQDLTNASGDRTGKGLMALLGTLGLGYGFGLGGAAAGVMTAPLFAPRQTIHTLGAVEKVAKSLTKRGIPEKTAKIMARRIAASKVARDKATKEEEKE